MRSVLSFILVFFLAFPLVAQEQKVDRSSTGGAQTLEDIMAVSYTHLTLPTKA